MGFLDKLKSMVGVDEEEEEIDNVRNESDGSSSGERISVGVASEKSAKSSKVMNINSTMRLKVVLAKSEQFEDASKIADHLNEKKTVVLNLESTKRDVARRLIDFLSGVAYANNGQIKEVARSTYIITPFNVEVMGDLLEELGNSGIDYGNSNF